MNLNQLRFVQAVAEAGTFTAGAARCYVTQSTLSSGVAQLERELGERLFVRTTRSVGLTAFGRLMLPLILDVLRAQQRLTEAAAGYVDFERREVRVGLCPLVELARIERVLAPYRAANHRVEIVLEQLPGIDPREALEARRFDFLIGPAEVRHPEIQRARLYEDELVYLRAGGPRPGATGSVTLRDIADDTFLLVPERCGLTIRTRQLFRTRRLPLKPYQGQAVNYQVLEEWAGMGIGSAILPRSNVSSPGSGQPIVLGNRRAATIVFEVAWSTRAVQTAHVRALADHFAQAGIRSGG